MIETYEIWVLLSTDFGKTFMGYDETAPYEQAAHFHAEAASHEGAAEVTFAICNSYANELHCDEQYRSVVEDYRTGGFRSLSVGDVVIVEGKTFSCERAGWKERP